MIKKIEMEWICWVGALIALAISDPTMPHYTLCLFRLLGWHHCPGCGIGHAIAYLLRGNLTASWQSHPLGGFALIILLQRIYVLSIRMYKNLKTYYHGSQHILDTSGR